jgi:hypothetical protein
MQEMEDSKKEYEQKLAAAVYEWRKLQDRKIHPPGKFDNGGRFYSSEHFDCCSSIRSPSRAYPYSEMVHCRSYVHIAAKYGVDVKDLRKECRACSVMNANPL